MQNLRERGFEILRRFFQQSSRLHIRENNARNLHELVALIDRFLDDKIRYPLEWDDFISWKNENAQVEEFRIAIAEFEPLLFSKAPDHRREYVCHILAQRNRAAAQIRIPIRDFANQRSPI